MNSAADFYCLNFHPDRREQMVKKLDYFQIPIVFYDGVPSTDPRIKDVDNPGVRRTASICYGHLDMLRHFVENSTKEYIVLMEDDILIKETFVEDITNAIDVVRTENLDILLIGFLCHNPIHTYSNFPEFVTKYSCDDFRVFGYPEETWGTQMYMVSRHHAERMVDKYSSGYLERSIAYPEMIPFSADWLLTKDGKRALLYPLRVIENGSMKYDDEGQETCRILCSKFTSRRTFI